MDKWHFTKSKCTAMPIFVEGVRYYDCTVRIMKLKNMVATLLEAISNMVMQIIVNLFYPLVNKHY